jgi:hypothetical protein
MKSTSIFYSAFVIVLFNGCNRANNADEVLLADRISAILSDAKVVIKKGIAVNSDEGTFSKFEIEIIMLASQDNLETRQLLFASSVPALTFLKEYPPAKKYKYLDIVVKNEGMADFNTRYSLPDLVSVDECWKYFQGYLFGIKEINKDSLTFYSDSMMAKEKSINGLVNLLTNAQMKIGSADEVFFDGFSIEKLGETTIILYTSSFKRTSGSYKVEIGINPLTKKVVYYNL